MTWVAWRQGRSENLVAIAVLAALATLLILTGAHMRAVFDAGDLARCTGASVRASGCSLLTSDFESQFNTLDQLGQWLGLTSGLLGVLLATPLVLELDQGTYRLAWTQSVTARRWLTTRLAIIVLGAVVCGSLISGLATWGRAPLDSLIGRIDPNSFDVEGIVPSAYTLFAASIVLAIGALTRRTGLAVSAGYGIYVIARLVVRAVRQDLVPAIHALLPLPRGPHGIFLAWRIDHSFTRAHGRPLPYSVIAGCFAKGEHLSLRCMEHRHVYQSFVYEPASRFWSLQAAEAGIFIAIAAAAIGVTVWWITHRIA